MECCEGEGQRVWLWGGEGWGGEGPIEIQVARWFGDSSMTHGFKAYLIMLWWKACGELEQSMQQSLDLTACKGNTV